VADSSDDAVEAVLAHGELDLYGRLVDASNVALVGYARLDGLEVRCVYKPTAGERPLWDFPTGTLGLREVAAYRVSHAAGWNLVPVTAWRADGPAGEGMCQAWIDVDESVALVDVVPRGRVPEGWRHVLDAEGARGRPVTLVHADTNDLRAMAVFDAAVNNADRKGGHVLVDSDGRARGVDHGVTFSEDDKLRTVLWGWAGEPIGDDLLADLTRLRSWLDSIDEGGIHHLLDPHEVSRTIARVDVLLHQKVFPLPGDEWPMLPWPAF